MRSLMAVVLLGFLLGLGNHAIGEEELQTVTQAVPFTKSQGEQVAFTYIYFCKNTCWIKDCWCENDGLSSIFKTMICEESGIRPNGHSSPNQSIVDNLDFAHIHMAHDYTYAPQGGGCGSCSGSASPTADDLPRLALARYHRFRDVSVPGSFGAGVFSNFDLKIFLNVVNGAKLIDVFDPLQMNTQKMVDGPYTHPFNPNDTLDGVYSAYKTHAYKNLTLYDVNGNVTSDQSAAKTAVLLAWHGAKYTFQVVSIDGQLAGRVTKMEDRNGYAINITYKYQPGDDLMGSEARLWQMDTASDAHGKQMTFTYKSTQEGGRWVVESVALPNATSVTYGYDTGYLSSVSLPDGTGGTFTRAYNATANCTTVTYVDPSAGGTHRTSTVYLTTNFGLLNSAISDDVFPSAAQVCRMVLNGNDEVSYLNIPDPQYTRAYIYEGNGSMKHVYCGEDVRFATSWTATNTGGSWTYANVSAGLEGNFEHLEFSSANSYFNWYKSEPTYRTDKTGRRQDFLFDEASRLTKQTYSDTTFETFTYNAFKQVTQHVDRLNRVTEYTYDSRGNMLTKTVGKVLVAGVPTATPETATYAWEYYASGHANQFLLKSATDANGNVTDYEYDGNQFLVKIKEPADNTGDPRPESLFAYDSAGRVVTTTDQELRVHTYEYDSRNRLVKKNYTDNTSEEWTYGTGAEANLLVSSKDRLGNSTTFAYDASGRQITRTSGANDASVAGIFSCTYKVGTNLHDTCTDRGNATTYTYDYRNRQKTRVVQPNRTGTGGAAKLLTQTTTYTKNEVTSVTDEYGRRTHYVYASADPYLIRTVRETTPSGASGTIATLARDASNNAKFVIEDMTVDAEGQVLAKVDGRNIEHTMSYDSRGRMTSMVESARQWDTGTSAFVVTQLGAKTEITYDAQSNRTQVKRPRSFVQQSDGSFVAGSEGDFITKYTYTNRNLTKSVTEAFGRTEAATEGYVYWRDRRIKDRVDARGNTWTTLWSRCCGFHEVDAQPAADVDDNTGTDATRAAFVGNRNSVNLEAHSYVVPDWSSYPQDPQTIPTPYFSPTGTLFETTTKYDARLRPIARTQWYVSPGTVNKNGPPIAGDNGVPSTDGLTTRWVYDENLTDGIGLDATYATKIATLGATYFGAGSVGSAVEVTNPNGEKSVAIMDGLGRTVLTIDGNLNTRRVVYDVMVSGTTGSQGNLLETTFYDGLSHTNKTRVDGIGRTLATIDGESRVTAYGFDANANQVKSRDPNSVGLDCVYDARNRRTQCTDTLSVDGTGAATGDVTKYSYDNHNNLTKTTDAKNVDTVCSYDGRDRKVTCTDRNTGVTAWAYDANSNLLSLTDADTSATTYEYDPRNLRVKETYPGHSLPGNNEIVAFAFDAAGRMTRRTDQNLDNTLYVYDHVNRLIQRTYPDALNDTFAYDNASRLTDAYSNRFSNLVHRVYDAGGRMTSEALTIDGQTYTTASAYDAANRRTSITYPNGKVVAQTFTNRDQLSNVKYDAVNVATLTYDLGMRKVTNTFGNSKVETRTYRGDNRTNTIAITTGITNFTYAWDVNKNKTQENDAALPTNVQDYSYDNEDRLTGFARNSGQTQAWTLSLVGDWTAFNDNGSAQARTHDAVHELTAINGTPLTYDLKGNLTTNSNAQTYTWDFENCMKTATVGADTATYRYDAFRRRVKKSFQGNSTVFAYDGWRSIAEYDNGAAPSTAARLYVFGTYLDEPLMMLVGSTKYYYHANDLYSVAALTNSSGTVVERYKYDPYGKVTVLDASGTAKSDPNNSEYGNPFTYTGQRLDKETGLMYYKNRYYSTGLGRFVSRDPIGYEGGKNLYGAFFVPNMMDSLGLVKVPKLVAGPTEWSFPEKAKGKPAPEQERKDYSGLLAKGWLKYLFTARMGDSLGFLNNITDGYYRSVMREYRNGITISVDVTVKCFCKPGTTDQWYINLDDSAKPGFTDAKLPVTAGISTSWSYRDQETVEYQATWGAALSVNPGSTYVEIQGAGNGAAATLGFNVPEDILLQAPTQRKTWTWQCVESSLEKAPLPPPPTKNPPEPKQSIIPWIEYGGKRYVPDNYAPPK